MRVFFIIFTLFLCVISVENAKILGIFPTPSKSHHILGSALMKGLAKKGHQVTVISPFPLKNPIANYKDIDITEEVMEVRKKMDLFADPKKTTWEKLKMAYETVPYVANIIVDTVFTAPEVQKMIQNNEKYDAVILFYAFADSFLGLAHQFNASAIPFSPVPGFLSINDLTGNPIMHSYVSHPLNPVKLSTESTFFERLVNFVAGVGFNFFVRIFDSWHESKLKQHLPNSPSLQELKENVALVLINSHYSLEVPAPYVPAMVQIGGFHVSEQKALPTDLQKFMDDAKEGVILFCYGSNVKISSLSQDKLNIILKVLGEMAPVKILFKSEIDLPNIPKNIKVSKWLPQRDVLAHPNTKVFVTHGGFGGVTEGIYHGVPFLGTPFYGDQPQNVEEIVKSGYGLKLVYDDITEKTFKESLKEVLENPKYRETIQLTSKLLKDQPMDPMDKAVYWVEHVVKHKGAEHLKSPGRKLPWYQYHSVDVVLFLSAILLVIFYIWFAITRAILRAIFRKLWGKGNSNKKVKTN